MIVLQDLTDRQVIWLLLGLPLHRSTKILYDLGALEAVSFEPHAQVSRDTVVHFCVNSVRQIYKDGYSQLLMEKIEEEYLGAGSIGLFMPVDKEISDEQNK